MYRPCLHCEGKIYDKDYCPEICTYGEARKRLEELEEASAIEVEPVIHAKWLVIDSFENLAVCSHCGHSDVIVPGAIGCRFCRAKMDLKDD